MIFRVLHLLTLLIFITSCVQQGGGTTRSSKLSSNSTTNGGTTNSNNINELTYIQQSSAIYRSVYAINYNFADSFLLRGGQLNNYIQNNPTISNQLCVVSYYPNSPTKKILLMTAQKQSLLNFSTGIREYFLNLQPNNSSFNQTNCSSTALITKLQTIFGVPSSSFAFAITDVCPNCNSSLVSSSIRFFQSAGNEILSVGLSQLKIQLLFTPTIVDGSPNYVCSTTENCTALGYKCCVDGQCVNDGQVKNGVDKTSGEFLISQIEIAANANRFTYYPQYYYICPITPIQNTSSSSAYVDPSLANAERLAYLKELSNCVGSQEINGITDEMSICSAKISSILDIFKSSSNSILALPASDLNFQSLNPYMPSSVVTEITYGGVTIGSLTSTGALSINTGINYSGSNFTNDSPTSAANLQINNTSSFPQGVANSNVKVSFKIDGSCEVISASTGAGTGLAKCKKYYYQGQTTSASSSLARPSDHPATCPGTYNGNCNQKFYLPTYTSTDYDPLVRLDGGLITKDIDWSWNTTTATRTYIDFVNGLSTVTTTVYSGQELEIEYFVTNSNIIAGLSAAKQLAQDQLNTVCQCAGDVDCNLIEVYDENDNIVDFKCSYPQVNVASSLNVKLPMTSNTVPVKFFNESGTHYTSKQIITSGGFGKIGYQEGKLSSYISSNGLYPQLTGGTASTSSDRFNEIYGTIGPVNGPQAPIMVSVKKGTLYDIYYDNANNSSFGPCSTCGGDTYSGSYKTLFPFVNGRGGGGYYPIEIDTTKVENIFGIAQVYAPYRAEDLAYGRSCFVPATMIPWSHTPSTDLTEQRRARMAAQHFLHVNGYSRDWYGFDYGSVIGSYDGVNWFSVGSARRTKAKSNRLYLAVNSTFGDLTNGAYNLTVKEVLKTISGETVPTNDLNSDGAECQKRHICETDNDCITQLGYEYTCANVSEMTTPWPRFDKNGNEIYSPSNNINIISLIDGGANGKIKRCIYRGRGAPCLTDPLDTNQFFGTTNSSTNSNTYKLHLCSANNYCSDLSKSNFNNRPVRFGANPNDIYNNIGLIIQNLNLSSAPTSNTASNAPTIDKLGLGAPILGRPWNFNGMEYPNSKAITTISGYKVLNRIATATTKAVAGVCVPGNPKDSITSFTDKNTKGEQKGDRITGAGQTASIAFTSNNANYYSSCPATDSNGVFNYNTATSPAISTNIANDAVSQNVSTDLLTDTSGTPYSTLFSVTSPVTNSATITSYGYQFHSCMRAPGASCFTDSDCAPNKFISNAIPYPTDWTYSTAERKYWSEQYICANERPKLYIGTAIPNIDWGGATPNLYPYTATANRCCRSEFLPGDTSNGSLSIYSQLLSASNETFNNIYMTKIAGVHIPLTSSKRYTRAHNLFNLTQNATTKYLPLVAAAPDALDGSTTFINQLEITKLSKDYPSQKSQAFTLQKMASDSCCSGHWVRRLDPSYHPNPNTDGSWDEWANVYGQDLDPSALKCLNWLPKTSATATTFLCGADNVDEPNTPAWTSINCRIKSYGSQSEISNILNWLGKFELTGIPQIAIEGNWTASAYRCLSNQGQWGPSDVAGVSTVTTNNFVFPMLNSTATATNHYEYWGMNDPQGFTTTSTQYYFSAADMSNFNTTATIPVKKIFSSDQFRCCTPHTTYAGNIEPKKCCTGIKNGNNCCLGDYTDVSIYLNKYVSSEANFLDDSYFDPMSGYIKDTELVMAIANGVSTSNTASASSLCCSGKALKGYAMAIAFIPGTAGGIDGKATTTRFLYDTPDDKNLALKTYYDAVYTWHMKWNNHVYCVPASFDGGSPSDGGATSQ